MNNPAQTAVQDQLDSAAQETSNRFINIASRPDKTAIHSPALVDRVAEKLQSAESVGCPHIGPNHEPIFAALWHPLVGCLHCVLDKAKEPPPPRDCNLCGRGGFRPMALVTVPWNYVTIFGFVCVDCVES